MRISSIGANYQQKTMPVKRRLKENEPVNLPQSSDVNFKGKHDCAKFLGGICGVLGTAGAVGGMLIMTGGLGAAALPWILGYGAASAGAGAIIGHDLDKTANKDDKK